MDGDLLWDFSGTLTVRVEPRNLHLQSATQDPACVGWTVNYIQEVISK